MVGDLRVINAYKKLLAFIITHKYVSLGILIILVWFVFSLTLSLMVEGLALWDAFWSILVFLTSGLEDQGIPGGGLNGGARVVAILAVLIGALTIGGFVATLASDLIKNIVHGQYVSPKSSKLSLKGHVVISGYNVKTKNIVRELRSPVLKKVPPVIIVTEKEEHIPIETRSNYRNVFSIFGTLIKDECMVLADLRKASALIILGEEADGRENDSMSFLIALAVSSWCPDLHVICELSDLANRKHFERIGVSEVIHSTTLTHTLIAQSIQSPGTYGIFRELLTFSKEGNEIYRLPPPAFVIGMSFEKAALTLLPKGVILTAIVRKVANPSFLETHRSRERGVGKKIDRFLINPPPGTRIKKQDELMVISLERPELGR